jgi:hypothetical protein
MNIALVVLALLILTIIVVGAAAAAGWKRNTAKVVQQLLASSRPHTASASIGAELASLPLPVQRYLRAALGVKPITVRLARIEQVGEFLLRPAPNGWRRFTAIHRAVTAPAGFVWDANIRMAPGVTVRVRDAFVDGVGSMHASIAGLRRVAHAAGTPEMATGALLRYLAEAVWFPTALLPSAGVRWAAIDETSARATLSSDGTTVSLDFFFGPDGMVERVYTAARAREVAGRFEATPWQGRFSRYEEHAGLLVPMEGEVEWVFAEGPQPYWRGRLTNITYARSTDPRTP